MNPEMDQKEELKDKIVKATKILLREKLIDRFGHVSARIPGKNLILIPAHRHIRLEEITRGDILTMSMAGEVVEGEKQPPGEKYLHIEIYRKRKDIGAVVHAHPPFTTTFSIADKPIFPVLMESIILAPEVEIYEYPCAIMTEKLGKEMATALGDRFALLLRSHGSVTAGKTVEEACMTTLILERTAQAQWMASSLGPIQTISDPSFRSEAWKDFQHFVESSWPDLESRID